MEVSLVIDSLKAALGQLFSARFSGVMLKSVGLTILLFISMWFALDAAVSAFLLPFVGPWPWVATAIVWVLGAGLFIGAGFLLAPVAALFAGLFLDDVADHVERSHYPDDPVGEPVPMALAIWLAVKFALVVIAANLLALMLVVFFGLGVFVFFLVNGYLLGREFFQFAAMRFRTEREAGDIRKRYSLEVFLAGLAVAAMMSVPILNLFAPVFAAATMVHLHKAVSLKEASQA